MEAERSQERSRGTHDKSTLIFCNSNTLSPTTTNNGPDHQVNYFNHKEPRVRKDLAHEVASASNSAGSLSRNRSTNNKYCINGPQINLASKNSKIHDNYRNNA